jgi:uncharacterized membrane protein YidH (DUF202 family)
MEIIDNQKRNTTKGSALPQRVYLGVVLILIGVVWMLYNFDAVGYRFFDLFFSWQMLLVAVGGYFLALKRWAVGTIVAGVGVFFVATDFLGLHIPFDKVALPVIVIAAGLVVLLSRGK